VFSVSWLAHGQTHPAGEYEVVRRVHPIVLDGQFTDSSEWSEAVARGGRWYESAGPLLGGLSPFTAGFRMLWDPDPTTGGLYVWGQMDHLAPFVTGTGPVRLDGSLDSVQLYFDPDSDFEDPLVVASNSPDGYHVAFNITGPNSGSVSAGQAFLDGGAINTGNLPISYFAHVNALQGNHGNPSMAGDPALLQGTRWRIATRGTELGWSFELFMPWGAFDACTGGTNGNGDGLCLVLDTLQGVPSTGDRWFFNFGSVFQQNGQNHYPSYASFPGDTVETDFAAGPHPKIQFVETRNVSIYDLNSDGGVDGADVAIIYSNWGLSVVGDINRDGVVDGADLGGVLAAWTGDAQPADHLGVPEPSGLMSWLWLAAVVRVGFQRCAGWPRRKSW